MSRPKVTVKDDSVTKKYFVMDTDYFTLKWPQKSVDTFADKIQNMIYMRKDHAGKLYGEIMKRMKFVPVKDEDLNINKIDYTETVIAFAEQFLTHTRMDLNPKQKTIDEALASKGKITPTPANKDSDADKKLKDDIKAKKSKK